LIKIVKVERIQDGVSRIVFKVGDAALKHIWQLENALNEIARALGVEASEAAKSVRELIKERDEIVKELNRVKESLMEELADELANKAEEVAGVNLVVSVVEVEDVRELVLRVARRLSRAVVGLVNKEGNYAIKVGTELVRGRRARFSFGQNRNSPGFPRSSTRCCCPYLHPLGLKSHLSWLARQSTSSTCSSAAMAGKPLWTW
jgi:alanyl-tRNA synthetase